MRITKIAAFDNVDEAALYANQLKNVGMTVWTTGPTDIVLIDRPGSAITGWSEQDKGWITVIGSEAQFVHVE